MTRKEEFSTVYDAKTAESFDLVAPHLIMLRDIYVLDDTNRELLQRVDDVAAAARSVTAVDSLEDAVILAMKNTPASALFVINIDIFNNTEDAVLRLLAAKNLLGDTPVIICSTAFAINNFSSQRRAIADASLRLPCSNASLAIAIESGINNSRNCYS